MDLFGIVLDWGFIVQVLILITLVYMAYDISKIRDHHQYMFEREIEKWRNDKK